MRSFAWIAGLMLSGAAAAPCTSQPFCKCGLNTVEDELARSDAVFTGVVLRVGELAADPAGDARAPAADAAPAGPSWPVTLRVSRAWKGAEADSVSILDAGGCAVGFREGDAYLVYAIRGGDGVLRTSYCMRTRQLAEVSEDLRVLDAMPPGRG